MNKSGEPHQIACFLARGKHGMVPRLFWEGKVGSLSKGERNSRIRKLAKQGVTYARIGLIYGITRQRVHRIVKPLTGRKSMYSKNPSKLGFLYIIRLDVVRLPMWGKFGFSLNPEQRISQAKTWWPNPKLIWKHLSRKDNEFRVIILMQNEFGCNFFDPRVAINSKEKYHELFECADYEELIKNLNATLKF